MNLPIPIKNFPIMLSQKKFHTNYMQDKIFLKSIEIILHNVFKKD
jgi:hypothetical protein